MSGGIDRNFGNLACMEEVIFCALLDKVSCLAAHLMTNSENCLAGSAQIEPPAFFGKGFAPDFADFGFSQLKSGIGV